MPSQNGQFFSKGVPVNLVDTCEVLRKSFQSIRSHKNFSQGGREAVSTLNPRRVKEVILTMSVHTNNYSYIIFYNLIIVHI